MGFDLRRTKILATLGPATDAPGVLDDLVRAGVNVVRLNFSHGTPDDQAGASPRSAMPRRGMGREVGILADLQGPKIRIEKFAAGKVELQGRPAASTWSAAPTRPPGDSHQVGVSYLGLVARRRASATRCCSTTA